MKAICLASGGELSLHPDCLPLIREYGANGIDLGFVSSGLLVNNAEWWQAINDNAKFIGFSMDAETAKDYAKVEGVPGSYFKTVLGNLEGMANAPGDVQVGYKFLLDRDNHGSIYEAAKLAREVGANHF